MPAYPHSVIRTPSLQKSRRGHPEASKSRWRTEVPHPSIHPSIHPCERLMCFSAVKSLCSRFVHWNTIMSIVYILLPEIKKETKQTFSYPCNFLIHLYSFLAHFIRNNHFLIKWAMYMFYSLCPQSLVLNLSLTTIWIIKSYKQLRTFR